MVSTVAMTSRLMRSSSMMRTVGKSRLAPMPSMAIVCHFRLRLSQLPSLYPDGAEIRDLDFVRPAAALIPYHEDLEAPIHRVHLESADAVQGRILEIYSVQGCNQVDQSRGRIDSHGPRLLQGGQVLDDGVAVGEGLADDGDAAVSAAVGGEDEAPARIVSHGVDARPDGHGRERGAGVGRKHF